MEDGATGGEVRGPANVNVTLVFLYYYSVARGARGREEGAAAGRPPWSAKQAIVLRSTEVTVVYRGGVSLRGGGAAAHSVVSLTMPIPSLTTHCESHGCRAVNSAPLWRGARRWRCSCPEVQRLR